MAVLRIHTVPDDEAFLRQRCSELSTFGPELKQLAADMLETLPVAKGIGLAAPQVGHSVRMVLIDISECGEPAEQGGVLPWENGAGEKLPPAFFLLNPVIESGEGEACLAEGCLSVPGIRVEVPRKARIRVQAQTLEGEKVSFEADDLLAIVIQHELDHLDGKLIADYAKLGYPTYRDEDVPEGRQILD